MCGISVVVKRIAAEIILTSDGEVGEILYTLRIKDSQITKLDIPDLLLLCTVEYDASLVIGKAACIISEKISAYRKQSVIFHHIKTTVEATLSSNVNVTAYLCVTVIIEII